MEIRELEKKLARLESINDQLTAEIAYVDGLLRSIGFTQGLESVKAVANEIITEGIGLEDAEN